LVDGRALGLALPVGPADGVPEGDTPEAEDALVPGADWPAGGCADVDEAVVKATSP
jgi:hypothetical protein